MKQYKSLRKIITEDDKNIANIIKFANKQKQLTYPYICEYLSLRYEGLKPKLAYQFIEFKYKK